MQSTVPDFDVTHFKSIMDEAPTKENGWELTYEGPILKEHPGIKFDDHCYSFFFRLYDEDLQEKR